MNLQKTHLYYRWGTGRLKTSTESLKKSHGLWLLELKSMCPNSIQCFFFYTEQVCFMSKENTFFFFFSILIPHLPEKKTTKDFKKSQWLGPVQLKKGGQFDFWLPLFLQEVIIFHLKYLLPSCSHLAFPY